MYLIVKRTFDFIISLVSLAMLSPLFLFISLAIKLDSAGPVLFKQHRFSNNKKLFLLLKFRTMRIDSPKDMPTHLLYNPNKWITSVGKVLRKSSLDELPQLINILAGDMSIIGPRPALWNQYDLINERDKYGANKIKPGLTGWAQINGRDELSISEKAKFDGEYVKKVDFKMDMRCLIFTIIKVIGRKGILEGKDTNSGSKFFFTD